MAVETNPFGSPTNSFASQLGSQILSGDVSTPQIDAPSRQSFDPSNVGQIAGQVASTAFKGLGSILNIIFSGYGLWKSSREQKKVERKEEQRYQTQLQLTKEAIDRQKKETARTWKWKEEEQDFSRKREAIGKTIGLLDRAPQFRNNLMSIWSRRT